MLRLPKPGKSLALPNLISRYVFTSHAIKAPNLFEYDNQVFYDNIKYGQKFGQGNVRDRKRDTKLVQRQALQKLTRVRVVDNSKLALQAYHRYPTVIQVYHKSGFGRVGDVVLLAIGGIMKKALIVGQKQPMGPMVARMDSNNVILIGEDGTPEGTRVTVPIPAYLRGVQVWKERVQMSKVIAIAGRLV